MTTRQRNTPYQAALPTGPTHVAARSNRTPAEVESNRVFMAAAGRVEFGRHENTRRAGLHGVRLLRQFRARSVSATPRSSARRKERRQGETRNRRTSLGVNAHSAPSHSRTHRTRTHRGRTDPSGRADVPTVWKILVSEPAPIEPRPDSCVTPRP